LATWKKFTIRDFYHGLMHYAALEATATRTTAT